jgi:superfamily I DNA/RNA helicase
MSVIKGTVEAVKSANGILSKDAYLSYKGISKGSTLCYDQRENVYHLFLQYEKLKRKARAYDLADRVWHLYEQLASGGYRGDKMEFVYVDEVQDFTLAQLSLFSFISSNPQDGFVFAGDTAQVITRGVNFRFQDARSLFYKDYGQAVERMKTCGTGQKVLCQGVKNSAVPLFQLSHNFRTHMGVVNMANSIINLLYHFFPLSIDKLDCETSLVSGELPVLLMTKREQILKLVSGSGGDAKMECLDFGANQAILVRDEDQKRNFLEKSGGKALVLTISGCKGLEFQVSNLRHLMRNSIPI